MRQTRTAKKRERDLTMNNPVTIDLSSDEDVQLTELAPSEQTISLPTTSSMSHDPQAKKEKMTNLKTDILKGDSLIKSTLKKAVPAFNITDADLTKKEKEIRVGGKEGSEHGEYEDQPQSTSDIEDLVGLPLSSSQLPLLSTTHNTTHLSESGSLSDESDSPKEIHHEKEGEDDNGFEDLAIVDVYEFPDSKKFLRQRRVAKRPRSEQFDNKDSSTKKIPKKTLKEEKQKVLKKSLISKPSQSAKRGRAGLVTRRSRRTNNFEDSDDSDLEITESSNGSSNMPVIISV